MLLAMNAINVASLQVLQNNALQSNALMNQYQAQCANQQQDYQNALMGCYANQAYNNQFGQQGASIGQALTIGRPSLHTYLGDCSSAGWASSSTPVAVVSPKEFSLKKGKGLQLPAGVYPEGIRLHKTYRAHCGSFKKEFMTSAPLVIMKSLLPSWWQRFKWWLGIGV